MSLQTIIAGGLTGHLHLRREPAAATIEPRLRAIAVVVSGGSMRSLETGMALMALATAFLIGLGR